MKTTIVTGLIATAVLLFSSHRVLGQCANTSNIYSFNYNGKTYEVIKEKKTWVDAAACAVERGGALAEINSQEEQNKIYTELTTNAGIDQNEIRVSDGGNAPYVWIGGNDFSTEGTWIWDGDNDGSGTHFWTGKDDGSTVGGLYHYWGFREPDDYQGAQDGMAIGLTSWANGSAGEWNDISHSNSIYYVVEYATVLSYEGVVSNQQISIYPNPVAASLTIEAQGKELKSIAIHNIMGQEVQAVAHHLGSSSKVVNLSKLSRGVYFVSVGTSDGAFATKKIIKQ